MFEKISKNLIVIIVIASFLPAVVSDTSASGASTFVLKPFTDGVKVGDLYRVDVNIEPPVPTIDTIRVNIEFTPGLLVLESALKNSGFTINSGGNILDNENGVFSYGAGNPEGLATTTRYLTLVFRAKEAGTAIVRISADSLMLSNGENLYNGQPYFVSVNISEGVVVKGESTSYGLKYVNGSLLRSSNHRVYLIIANQKKYLSTISMLSRFKGVPIINVDDSVLSAYTETSMQILRNNYKDGTLIKGEKTKAIYVIQYGMRKKISNLTELAKYKGKVLTVSEDVITSYPSFPYVVTTVKTYPNGTLVKNISNNKIYVINNNKKAHVASLAELQKYAGRKILELAPQEINDIKDI